MISWMITERRHQTMGPVVLDSFALVSLFHREPGWEKVRDVLRDLDAKGDKVRLCLINWGEFYYVLKRRVGRRKAEEALLLLAQLPVEVEPVDQGLVKEAAEIKADYPVSYADAFCIATALRSDAYVMTSDPEFKAVQHLLTIAWL